MRLNWLSKFKITSFKKGQSSYLQRICFKYQLKSVSLRKSFFFKLTTPETFPVV